MQNISPCFGIIYESPKDITCISMNIGRRSQLRSMDGKLALVVCLTHSGFVTHLSINDLHWFRQWLGTWHQAITWTSYDLWTNFCEIWTKIQNLSIKKIHLKISSAKWRPFCSCLSVSTITWIPDADITIWHWIGWSRVFHYRSPSTDPSHWNCTSIPCVRYNINTVRNLA